MDDKDVEKLAQILRDNGYTVHKNKEHKPTLRRESSMSYLREYCRFKYGKSPMMPYSWIVEGNLINLKELNVGQVFDYLNNDRAFLLKQRNIGKKSCQMIKDALMDFDLTK